MRILITGGAGFIGTWLTRELLSSGVEVVVLDNLHPQVHGPNAAFSLTEGAIGVRGDVRDPDVVRRALGGVSIVFHLAAETGVGQSQYETARYVSTNTLGTAVVLDACVRARVDRVVIASSRAVCGEGTYACAACGVAGMPGFRPAAALERRAWDPLCSRCGATMSPEAMTETTPSRPVSIYGWTKLQQEQIASQLTAAHGLPISVARLFNVYGPGQSLKNPYVGILGTFYHLARSHSRIELYEDGRMLRDFVHVRVVVETLKRLGLEQTGAVATVNVASGRPESLSDVAAHICRAAGRVPDLFVSGRFRLGDVRHTVADTSVLTELVGPLPQPALGEGLREFVEWADRTEGSHDYLRSFAEANSVLEAAGVLKGSL